MKDPRETELTRRDVLRRGGATAGGLVVGSATLTGSAAADPAEKDERDLTGETYDNPCTREQVEVTRGVLQSTLHVHRQNRCQINGTLHLNFKGVQAVGLDSGNKYQLNANLTLSVQGDICDGPASETGILNLNFVSQGSADNYQVKIRIHTTINANGDVTVDFDKGSRRCVG